MVGSCRKTGRQRKDFLELHEEPLCDCLMINGCTFAELHVKLVSIFVSCMALIARGQSIYIKACNFRWPNWPIHFVPCPLAFGIKKWLTGNNIINIGLPGIALNILSFQGTTVPFDVGDLGQRTLVFSCCSVSVFTWG